MVRMGTIIVAVALATPASTPIAAGRWVVDNRMVSASFDGDRDDGPFPPSMPHTVCLAAADAARGPGLAFADERRCTVARSVVGDGAFAFRTECKATESDDLIVTDAAGRYTAERYDGTSTSVQRRGATRIEMRSRMEARRVGDC